MNAELPEPLVPAEVDLRGLPFMPLDVVRLMDSDLFALSNGEEFKAAVALWCKCWLQVPAGSLPNDDRVLAHLSGSGSRWAKVKAMALRGFTACADGRFYHAVIAEKAMDAWQHRIAQRDRAAKRWQSDGNATAHATAHATAMQGTGRVKGQGKGVTPHTPRSVPLPDWVPAKAWDAYVAMRKALRKPITAGAVELALRELDKLRQQGQDPVAVLEQSTLRSWQGIFAVKPAQVDRPNRQQNLEDRNRAVAESWTPPELKASDATH